MSREQSFLQAMLANPDDLDLRQVFADWLEEQGDPRGELLRLTHVLTQAIDCFQLARSETSLQQSLPSCEVHCHPTCRRAQREARLYALLDEEVQAVGPFWTNEFGMRFAWVPPGKFVMGTSPREVEWIVRRDPDYASSHFFFEEDGSCYKAEPRREVTITKGFFMGAHCVTPEQWNAVLGPTDRMRDWGVTWTRAVRFCNALSSREGRNLYYEVRNGPWGTTILSGSGYCLPTEAEWEYACRAGSSAAYCFGDDPDKLDDYAQKKPNAWGLYGMHGHPSQWSWDEVEGVYRVFRPGRGRGAAARRSGARDWEKDWPDASVRLCFHLS
jgi:uncharacterized protein (TIGR02996 family)